MKSLYTSTILCCLSLLSLAQNPTSLPGPITVCPAGEFTGHHHTPSPKWIQDKLSEAKDSENDCGTITVDYIGFTAEAEATFQAAVDIWESVLETNVNIEVEANWTTLGEGVLGSAGPNTIWTDFSGAPEDHYYPSALADQLHGGDLDPNQPDIITNFNSEFDWYFGTDGNPPNDQFDLLSVVLHELGHGLGFISTKDYDDGEGSLGFGGIPYTYDTYLTLGDQGQDLLSIFNPLNLGDALTSENVFSSSPSAASALGGQSPQHYAPADYASGSSISHWDEFAFGAGDINSLMSPQIGPGEGILDPGPITLGLFEDIGWVLCGNVVVTCQAEDLVLSGEAEICPDETTSVDLDEPNIVPGNGGEGIRFYNGTDVDIYLSGVTFPYSFNNDLNGVLTANDFDPFLGVFELTTFVYTDPTNAISSICSESTQPVTVTFFSETDAECNVPICVAQDLTLDGPSAICPDETTTVDVGISNDFPTGGGEGIRFDNGDGINIILSGIEFPYSFDNDLNGLLSANNFDPFIGIFELTTFVYSDENDVGGSICSESTEPVTVTFFSETDAACNDPICLAQDLIIDGPDAICPDETTTVDIGTSNDFPVGGGEGIRFDNGDGVNIILSGIGFPYSFDNDLNGVLSANNFDPFIGIFELTTFVYSDENDVGGSICDESQQVITVTFYAEDDAACNEITCLAQNPELTGPENICPGETTSINLNTPQEIPAGGGQGLRFDNGNDVNLILSGVSFPFSFDNDLNGVLSQNDIDPFEGNFDITAVLYTNENDPAGSICSESSGVESVNFLTSLDAPCAPQACLDWQQPEPGEGWSNFNDLFGGAPCDPGTGCPIFEITDFQAWAGEAYAIDNLVAGGVYTFGICNGPGAGTWIPEFTILSPSGNVDAFGSGSGCSITWAASESGTYLIVINEEGNCGEANQIDNGFPSITCEGDLVACPVECSAGAISPDDEASVCFGLSTLILNTEGSEGVSFPEEGGYRLRVEINGFTYFLETDDPEFGFEIDNDLMGVVSGQDDDLLVGTAELTAEAYENSNDPDGTICSSSNVLSFDFLAADDADCITGIADFTGPDGWKIFPNPTSGNTSVQFKSIQSGILTVAILDSQGRTVHSQGKAVSVGSVNLDLNVDQIAQGYYHLTLRMNSVSDSKPLVISR